MLDIVYNQKEKNNSRTQKFVIWIGKMAYMNQKTKYVLEIAKLHTDACTN